LIKHLGGADQIDPQGDHTDDQLGAFMMFSIKDLCHFAGMIEDLKKPKKEI